MPLGDAPYERVGDGVLVSTERARLDVALVHRFLNETYWAAGIPMSVVVRSIEHSVAFGLYRGPRQIGFARVVSDLATYGYLADVFIVEEERGRGLGEWLVESILLHPELRGLRRFALFTKDAASLYARHGFVAAEGLPSYMEIVDREVYRRPQG
jgi:GNAT superfamily N-acetyltransferase